MFGELGLYKGIWNKAWSMMLMDGKSGDIMVMMMLGTPGNGCNRMVMKKASRSNSHVVDSSFGPNTNVGCATIVSSRITKYIARCHSQPSGRAGGVSGRGKFMGEGIN